jgi:hypothetical protein
MAPIQRQLVTLTVVLATATITSSVNNSVHSSTEARSIVGSASNILPTCSTPLTITVPRCICSRVITPSIISRIGNAPSEVRSAKYTTPSRK